MLLSKTKLLCIILFAGIFYILFSNKLTQSSSYDIHKSKVEDVLMELTETKSMDIDGKADNGITYTRIHEFLLSTPKNVMQTTPPQFLTDVKNPCFAIDENLVNIGNINLSYALKMNYEIRCFPYVYIAGVEKCGTSELHHSLINHQLVLGFLKEDQLKEYETKKASGNYEKHHILGQMDLVQDLNDMHLKESHFWDNFRCVSNFTLDRLSRRCTPELIIRSHMKYGNSKFDYSNEDDLRDMVYMDSTPRMIAGHFSWNEEEVHWREREPQEFIPDRLHHVTPDAKVIMMLRDPVARTFSDYRYLTKDDQSATDFHNKVVDAISWWKNCTQLYKWAVKACAYGNAPLGMPVHNMMSCGLRGQYYKFYCKRLKPWGCANNIDRFRISFYHIYLAEWLRVFPRKNILFLKLEDMYKDKIDTFNRALKFLELPPLKQKVVDYILEKGTINKSKMKIEMLEETKQILEDFFEPMNTELSNLLQEDFYTKS